MRTARLVKCLVPSANMMTLSLAVRKPIGNRRQSSGLVETCQFLLMPKPEYPASWGKCGNSGPLIQIMATWRTVVL